MTPPTAILDVDGTLVDTNYHHALAWFRAFRQYGIHLPIWRIHRHIGMGGDQLVAALTDERTDEELGDDVRSAEKALYMSIIRDVDPLPGARDLIEDLKQRGAKVVLASSAKPDELEHYLDLLDARGLVDAWTNSGDVQTTKPAPDLITAALEKVGDGRPAVLVGDSTWDCLAAENAGVGTIAVLTGGFSAAELREAGADPVFESLPELRERLSETPLGRDA